MKTNDFCVLLLTHGRPNKVVTAKSLRRSGYTGPMYIVIDNEDKCGDEYRKVFGEENVIEFDKASYDDKIDLGDNFQGSRATITFARTAAYDIARKLGYKYFLMTDDDYPTWSYSFNSLGEFQHHGIKNIDVIFEIMLEFYKSIPAKSIAMAQRGDFLGGAEGSNSKLKTMRKAMNTFFCCVDDPINWVGRMNEDVCTYVSTGMRGDLFLTVTNVAVNHLATQVSDGGISEVYRHFGTYTKSFYSVMYAPSCVRVGTMGTVFRRLHHFVYWRNAVPKIVAEKYRKKSAGIVSSKLLTDDTEDLVLD